MADTIRYKAPRQFLWMISEEVPASLQVLRRAANNLRARGRDAESALSALEESAKKYGANAVVECRTEPCLRAPGVEAVGRAVVLGYRAEDGEDAETMCRDFRQPPPASLTEARYQARPWQLWALGTIGIVCVLLLGVLMIQHAMGISQ